MRQYIDTDHAPAAIGCYSQAVKVDKTLYLSGQIGVNPLTQELLSNLELQASQAFKNLAAVAQSSGGSLKEIVKLNIYILDMKNFAIINEVMQQYFQKPYPARAIVAVSGLPKGALVEIDGILVIN